MLAIDSAEGGGGWAVVVDIGASSVGFFMGGNRDGLGLEMGPPLFKGIGQTW